MTAIVRSNISNTTSSKPTRSENVVVARSPVDTRNPPDAVLRRDRGTSPGTYANAKRG